MGYEAWVESWQQQQLNKHLLEIYGPEKEDEEFDEIEHWPETDPEED
jgi:hypothetical protein